MPALLTDITELTTALGMLGYPSISEALQARPHCVLGPTDETWHRLDGAFAEGSYSTDFESAFQNGGAFLAAKYGLRDRIPLRIEWKGPHKTPGYELIPADLRVDHVFLVSCKYLSRVLFNASPSHLFRRLLAIRHGGERDDWYEVVAPREYLSLYRAIGEHYPELRLPESPSELTTPDRMGIKSALRRSWPEDLMPAYLSLCRSVSNASASIWDSKLGSQLERELMLWRLLRLASAPYFVLGASGGSTLRLRISTPWDWRQRFSMLGFEVQPDELSRQPVVRWTAQIKDHESGQDSLVYGHVEVRWSHGRFRGNPEAKVYLDVPYRDVPGYEPLEGPGGTDSFPGL